MLYQDNCTFHKISYKVLKLVFFLNMNYQTNICRHQPRHICLLLISKVLTLRVTISSFPSSVLKIGFYPNKLNTFVKSGWGPYWPTRLYTTHRYQQTYLASYIKLSPLWLVNFRMSVRAVFLLHFLFCMYPLRYEQIYTLY